MEILATIWGALKKVSFEVWAIVAIVGASLLGIYTVDRNAVKRTQAKNKNESLEATIVMQETSKEIVNEIEARVEMSEDAVARMPYFSDADSLRKADPDLAALILGDPAEHK